MSRKYSTEIKEKAIQLYNDGLPAIEISRIIGANEATIRKWLKDSGLVLKNGSTYSMIYDDRFVNEIIKLYESGINTVEIEKSMGLKRGIASYLLRKNGYVLNHKGPKSKIKNEDYFDIIDNQEKAYFLGWIMADGNISIYNGQYSLKIHIALRDKEIIDNFLKAIDSSNKTKVKEGNNPSYYVSLTSVHMCKALINLGVTPQKSGNEVFPDGVPKTLYNHFIRGVFDGDGITDIKRKRSGFVGSKNMLEKIIEVLQEPKIKIIANKKNEKIFYFLGGKKFSEKLYNYLYIDSKIWLQRKKERLESIRFE